MITFKNFNQSGFCPICGTNENKETVLIPITGTEKGAYKPIMKTEQIHLECLDLKVFKFTIGEWLIEQAFNPITKGEVKPE